MSCKGLPSLSEHFYITAVLSSIFAPITVIGNFLLMLTVVVDPLKELRTFFNLVYLNALLSDLCFGLFIDTYRAWGNKVKSDGINLQKEYPYSKNFGKACHIMYIAGQLVSFFALTIMSTYLVIYKDKASGKVSYSLTALVSVFIWVVAFGFSSFYFVYGYDSAEMAIVGVTTFGCLVAIIANYFILYQPARKRFSQVHAQEIQSTGEHDAPNKQEKSDSMPQVESKASREDRNDRKDSVKISHTASSKGNDSLNEEISQRSGQSNHQRLLNIKALIFYFIILFVFAAPAWGIGYAAVYDKMLLTCASGSFWRGWRMMFFVAYKAFNPFLCLLFIRSLRRGCLQMLRLRNFRRVAPNP